VSRVTRLLFVGVLLLGSVASAQTIADEQRALSLAKAQSKASAARADALQQKAQAEQNAVEKTLARSAAVASRIQSAEADIDAAEARIRLIEQLRSGQRARLATKQEPAIRLIAALQMMARRPPALALVQPGSTRDLVYTQAMLSSLLPVIEQRTAGLRTEVEASRRLRADADRALAALHASQERLQRQRTELVRLAAERRSVSQRFASGAMVEQDRAIALGERARDISELMDQLGNDAGRREALASLPGPLLRPAVPGSARNIPVEVAAQSRDRLPYRLPVTGRIVSGLGEISRAGVRARGITIATRPGAQVVSPTAGRIVFAGAYRGFGRIVIIDHGRGWTTLLTNLAALDIAVGDSVVQGSPIGRAPASEPTITVELRRDNQPVDIARLIV
jgi:murein hydrolase activator